MITAVVMVGEEIEADGPSAWVQGARRAAAQDLIDQLQDQDGVKDVILVSPSSQGIQGQSEWLKSDAGPIHVGRWLARIVGRFNLKMLLYFGGGAAPLLEDQALTEVVKKLDASSRMIITNNRFASDWAGITPASALEKWIDRLPQDNMLGWVLSTEADLPFEALLASASSRLDIDTPTDLLTLALHPRLKPRLGGYISRLHLDTSRMESLLQVMKRPASRLFVSGRLGPEAWQTLNKSTESWVRVLSEERGMISSGRQARGEVFSLLGSYFEAVGIDGFFEMLSAQCDAAVIDNRVLMAHRGPWPSAEDRFASDLGMWEQIEDEWLKGLTRAAVEAPIPIVFGGHGLLSGDLFALCEIIGFT